uniref:Hedgehog protein Hint domain-containing protein n=1 Tax=Chromera velia CCMP2878 TaxID=1169474 RepID=A0A0G4F7K7_9ALVE|eukprot:Cvel_15566.t1-p1 / transcript=Cvel_15566.t1 / gene=Cvel_15566 / organism=Chromera_velia_CCMP2878 / gene_product=hypothetical protein / transcript_product=hypothetical protein / location=Cvel_scaffold1157:29508-30614(-) / protein_length=255 / sequence_SO=supercontig / SO=protein_coding / is_pseudo=false
MLMNQTGSVCETAFEMESQHGLMDSWESVRDRVNTACDSATRQALSTTQKNISKSAQRECAQLQETIDHLTTAYPNFDHSVKGMVKHVVCSTAALLVGGDRDLVEAAEEVLLEIPKLFGVAIETEKKAMEALAGSFLLGTPYVPIGAREECPGKNQGDCNRDLDCWWDSYRSSCTFRVNNTNDCFPGRALVTSEKRGEIPISELQVGDRVLDDSGWTGILFFFHRETGAGGRKGLYLQVELENGGRLELSPAHFA